MTKKRPKTPHNKDKKGKPRISYIPEEAIFMAAEVFTLAAESEKYEPFSYRDGMEWLDLSDALDRHHLKFKKGIDLDEESGKTHIAHMLANVMMLAYMYENRKEFDNRYKFRPAKGKRK